MTRRLGVRWSAAALGNSIRDGIEQLPLKLLARLSLLELHLSEKSFGFAKLPTTTEASIAGVNMTDKHRHRYDRAPHGFLPNWVLMVLAVCAMAVAGLAHSMI